MKTPKKLPDFLELYKGVRKPVSKPTEKHKSKKTYRRNPKHPKKD